jgi:hypothetical protein
MIAVGLQGRDAYPRENYATVVDAEKIVIGSELEFD